MKKVLLLTVLSSFYISAIAQNTTLTNGIVYENKSGVRLANIKIANKKTKSRTITNDIGEFKIPASTGDTLEFSNDLFETKAIVADNSHTTIASLNKIIALKEVVIKENSLRKDLAETQHIYRSKGVFYIGRPHYYYLFLKPMTFIYENFKSEVINARRFKRAAIRDVEGQEISMRFNEQIVQRNTPLDSTQAGEFVIRYWPSIQQVRSWSDYDIVQYIKRSYNNFINENK
jgi:hypothetical protein